MGIIDWIRNNALAIVITISLIVGVGIPAFFIVDWYTNECLNFKCLIGK